MYFRNDIGMRLLELVGEIYKWEYCNYFCLLLDFHENTSCGYSLEAPQ